MVTTLRFSRAWVHNDWIVYIALPSPTMHITLRSGQATAAPGATGFREADRAAHVLQPVMRLARRRRREEAAAGGNGFVDDNGVLRDCAGDRLRNRGVVERAGRLDEFGELLRLHVGGLGAEMVGERFQRGN